MSWSTMHFAVGMACTGAAGAVVCSVTRRGWRWIPVVMTVGGIWANVPDMPRFWREDFPWLPFASTLGSMRLERFLHHWGDIFFFHATLDDQGKAYAMLGFFGVLVFYNLSIALLLVLEHRQRKLREVPLIAAPPRRTRRPHYVEEPTAAPAQALPSEDSVVEQLLRQLEAPRPPDAPAPLNTSAPPRDTKQPARR